MHTTSLLLYTPFSIPAFAALANIADFVYWVMLDDMSPGTRALEGNDDGVYYRNDQARYHSSRQPNRPYIDLTPT